MKRVNIRSQYQDVNRRWISQVLKEADISQSELARRIGVTGATISRWKSYGQIIGENIMQICLELGCRPPNWVDHSKDNPLPEMPAPVWSPPPAQIKEMAIAYKEWRLTDSDLDLLLGLAKHLSGIRSQARIGDVKNPTTQRGENHE